MQQINNNWFRTESFFVNGNYNCTDFGNWECTKNGNNRAQGYRFKNMNNLIA